MMSSSPNDFLIVLSIFASGYILYDSPIGRLWFPRFTGYILYFRIIAVGLGFFVLCSSLFYFDVFPSLPPEYPLSEALFLGALGFRILAEVGWVWFYDKRSQDWKDKLKLKSLNEKGLAQFVYNMVANKRMIMVTLENNKVYTGWTLEIPNNEDNKWLRLVPLWSGYRDKTAMIHVQINYSKVLDERIYEPMLIQVEKIVTAHPFNMEIFQKFHQKT